MKESAFSSAIRRTMKEQGHRAIKIHGGPMGESGIPDIYLLAEPLWRGWLELKMGHNEATEVQKRVMADLAARGDPCYVLRRADDGMLTLETPDGASVYGPWRGVKGLIFVLDRVRRANRIYP